MLRNAVYTHGMDAVETKAIQRILHSCRSQPMVHASDVAAGMRLMVPNSSYDEADVVKHLTFMVEQGYELPVPVLLT